MEIAKFVAFVLGAAGLSISGYCEGLGENSIINRVLYWISIVSLGVWWFVYL